MIRLAISIVMLLACATASAQTSSSKPPILLQNIGYKMLMDKAARNAREVNRESISGEYVSNEFPDWRTPLGFMLRCLIVFFVTFVAWMLIAGVVVGVAAGLRFMANRHFCIALPLVLLCSTASAQTYYYAYSSKSLQGGNFHFAGMTPTQTSTIIQRAFREMSEVSKAQFKPWPGHGPYHIHIWFKPKVAMDAMAASRWEGGRSVHEYSSTRKITEQQAESLVKHETLHWPCQYNAAGGDKWGHSPDRKCISSIHGHAVDFCPAEIAWLKKRYGVK